jgi:hypothetical protein
LTLAEELGQRPLQPRYHRAMDMAFWLPQAETVLAQIE